MDMRHRAANDGILIISSDCDYVQRDKMWKKKLMPPHLTHCSSPIWCMYV